MLEAHEVIGMDECPPSTFEFNPQAFSASLVLVDLGAYLPPCEAHEIIGFDEIPPSDYAPVEPYVRLQREPVGADEAFDVLDAAYDAGVESSQVFVSWLHEADVPACEAREFVAAWRNTHVDPWIRAYAENVELECA